MRLNLFPFQRQALTDLRLKTAEALGSYRRTHAPQVVSFTAPTGAGKTIIMASLIERIFFGDESFMEQLNAIVIWLSDSPQLNEQSKQKIDAKADKIRLGQCVTVTEDSFDMECFEDGHIYFLNTQKLSKTSKLTKNGDRRIYTIWQTIANTVREKSDRLYFIIDEAHRGMQGREASRATTIMQKFLKGSEEDGISPMPVVIGMSATPQRFNALVEGTTSTIYKSVVTAEEVRASGLLKNRIVITYPEESSVNKDMAILQAAADDWNEKWRHWTQYCQERLHPFVNPVFVIQVLNGSNGRLTDTDLQDCLQKIEDRVGFRFEPRQVVHTFGEKGTITVGGLNVRYVEPSDISDDRNIKVVFFKENLSTGWDCPRAETMMSFKRASDATYIAQLLGRMVRTPLQKRIPEDEVLNDVHLFLPHFDEDTVKDVVAALQSAEGGNIPTDVYGETPNQKRYDTLTVKPVRKRVDNNAPGQLTLDMSDGTTEQEKAATNSQSHGETIVEELVDNTIPPTVDKTENPHHYPTNVPSDSRVAEAVPPTYNETTDPTAELSAEEKAGENSQAIPGDLFDREKVMTFINDSGLLSYNVRAVRIDNYLISLFKMAHLLTMSGLHPKAIREVQSEIVGMIHDYVEELKNRGEYDDLVLQVKQVKLSTQIFDAFGETIDNYCVYNLFTTTDTDIDRQLRMADNKLGNEGIGNVYGRKYMEDNNPDGCKIDVILFAANEDSMNKLHTYAQQHFHRLIDDYRRLIASSADERMRKQYDSIVSDGDTVSKHNFRLPETIQVPHETGGKEYRDHLFVSDTTGTAVLKLNTWEIGTLEEEQRQKDYVCFIRNPPRGAWALCIPYEMDGEMKPTYPDFIIVRRDTVSQKGEYIIDILEPHRPDLDDNLGKAKGFAEYARQNPGLGRIQLIRQMKQASGTCKFKRLDMSKSAVRDKVSHAQTSEELDHIFDTDGFFV